MFEHNNEDLGTHNPESTPEEDRLNTKPYVLLEQEANMLVEIMEQNEQSSEAKDALKKIESGESLNGFGHFMDKHPGFANLTRALLLASSLTGAYLVGKGSSGDEGGYLQEPARAERVLSPKEMPRTDLLLEKSKMEVVKGVEGDVWTHAPAVPPMPNLEAPPRIVDVHWNIIEQPGEIAPGETYVDRWTIEGSVPGPMIRLVEGDVLRISLTNKGLMPHNLDFHAITGPGGGGRDLMVNGGETAIIEARMMAPGLFQVHCAPAKFGPEMIAMHVANGMSGFVLVQPRDKQAPINQPVDHEWYLAQNEWYSKPTSEPGKVGFDMEAGKLRQPSHIVFNGSAGSLTGDKALSAKTGENIRLYVGDSGPNFPSNFHAIGEIFNNVYREGDLVSEPGHDMQTTIIPPGGSSVVEFKAEVPGEVTLVTHDLFSLIQGAVAKINISGPENPQIYEVIQTGHAQ